MRIRQVPRRASATSRSPACRSATSPTSARSTIRTCSRCSTNSATTAGSAASTGRAAAARRARRPPGSAGCGPGWIAALVLERSARCQRWTRSTGTTLKSLAAARQRQGAGQLCGRRRPPADGDQRPAVGLRRGDGRADPRQGQGAQHAGAVLVRPAVGHRAEPPDRHRAGDGGRARRGRAGARPRRWSCGACSRCWSRRWCGATSPAPAARSTRRSGSVCGIALPPGLQQAAEAARADLHAGGQGRARASTTRTSASSRWSPSPARRWPNGSARSASRSIAAPATMPPAAASSSPTPSSSSDWTNKGELYLMDEVLTPDSSRFWPASRVPRRHLAAELRQAVRQGLPGDRQGLEQARAAAAVAGRRWSRPPPARYREALKVLTGSRPAGRQREAACQRLARIRGLRSRSEGRETA